MRSTASAIGHVVPAIAMLAVMQIGCATTQTMSSSPGVPASKGTVTTSELDKNGNTKVSVLVEHLALPWKVESDAKVYVVWIQPTGGVLQNAGVLIVNDELEGTLETVTPHLRFQVTVTPEPSGQVELPTHAPVMTMDVDRPEK